MTEKLIKCSFILDGKRCNKRAEYEIISDTPSAHKIDQCCASHIKELLSPDADEFTIYRI